MKKFDSLIKNSILITAVLCCFVAKDAFSQAPQIQWAKCYGGSSNDRATDVHRTTDSGYVVCGYTSSTDGQVTNNHGGIDGWIIKLDVSGNLQWEKTYGGSADDALNAIRQLPDGGFITCGYTASTDGDVETNYGAKDFWVIKTDASGNISWEKTFGGTLDESANDLASTGDTGFVVVGYTFSNDGQVNNYKGGGDGWLVYLDQNGNFLKQKDKGGSAYDEFKSIITAGNGGFLLSGVSFSNDGTVTGLNHGGSDAWLARLSRFGTDQWNGLYGATLDDGAFDVHENENADFVVSGYRDFNGQNDSWLFVVDTLGVFLSEGTHGGSGDELAGASIEKTVSNYIVAGSSNSDPSGDKDCHYAGYDIWAYNTLSGGAITWQKCLGGTADDVSSRAVASPDGSITICGYTNSTDLDVQGNHGDYDFWVVRLLDGCDVTAAFTENIVGEQASFTNNSFDALSFYWTFGDGTSSTEINPVHVYAGEGTYTVCLIATSLCTADTVCTEVNIACNPATSSFTYVDNNFDVDFTSTSANATSWNWSFGDGGTSTDQNPSHTYATIGTYQVCLIVSNFCSSDTLCQEVNVVCTPIVSSYTYTVSNTTVSFTSTAAGATAWKWKFGDGGNSNQANPTHTYADTGLYYVCLVAFNVCSTDTFCDYVHITCAQTTSAFAHSENGLDASFTDLSTYATSWSWDFGDGSTSNLENPSHTYALNGTYNVCLIASNDCSSDTTCTTVTVECIVVSAGFNYSVSGFTVNFTDLSNGATGWTWTFGDGNSSNAQNPSHTYATSGTYTVCLTAFNDCSQSATCTDITIACPVVSAGFDYSVNALSASFTDLSNGASSWHWNFGDGTTSNQQNPNHTYATAGTYLVCLTAYNVCDSSTSCTEVTVECPPFTAAFSLLQQDATIVCTDESGSAIQWEWSFGDGSTSNLQNPSHTYSANGIYLVCLVAYDGCSYDSTCDSIAVIGLGTGNMNTVTSAISIYPNPTNDQATISLFIAVASPVNITLNDLQGRMLSTLIDKNLSAGNHSFTFSRQNLPAGVYLLHLRQGNESKVLQLIIE